MFLRSKVTISKATIDRLPLYFRTLRMSQEAGKEIISSEELGKTLDVTPEQIRKDLASFGQFGKKGVGYFVRELTRNIGEILGLQYHFNIAVVGVGHLGAALANYQNIGSLGFRVVALFDSNPELTGKVINGVPVEPMVNLVQSVKEKNVNIGIIAVPAAYAQSIANKLVEGGVDGIWNFAPIRINVPTDVQIIHEDLSIGLSSLSYHIARNMMKNIDE